jgi:ribosomal protein S18 acetylase RimI-like enzyme|tara:strand:- start:45 stop:818 length:774 start_codon:yes stop_codon:yes gene_type:complete
MNMDSLNKLKQFEENENSWFSFFSDCQDIGYAQIFINEKLVDDPLYNHATSINCASQEAVAVLNRVASKFRRKKIIQCFYLSPLTSPIDFKRVLEDNGFKEWDQLNIMEYVGPESDFEDDNILVRRVGMEAIKKWIRIFSSSFEIPLSQVQEYSVRNRFLFPRSDIDFYLAYIGGKAAGCAALYSNNSVGGIYVLGSLKEFRNRGIVSSILKAAVTRSKERNNDSLILQFLQKDDLESFYRNNGFKKVYSKKVYRLK